MPLDLGDNPPRLGPGSGLIAEIGMEPAHMVRRSSDWAREQIADPALQNLVGRQPDRVFDPLRLQPRRPPLAKIRPGRPAPAMGPGTGDATRPEVLKAQVLRASVQKPVAPAATWLRAKPWGDPVPQGRNYMRRHYTIQNP